MSTSSPVQGSSSVLLFFTALCELLYSCLGVTNTFTLYMYVRFLYGTHTCTHARTHTHTHTHTVISTNVIVREMSPEQNKL